MSDAHKKLVTHLIIDTTAFIQNAPVQTVAENLYTIKEVVDEIKNKPQLRRLCVLPYTLIIKDVFSENVKAVTEFSKKTGDYRSLSATDIKLIALAYQLEKEHIGTDHLRSEPVVPRSIQLESKTKTAQTREVLSGFYKPKKNPNFVHSIEEQDIDEILPMANESNEEEQHLSDSDDESDDESAWITPENLSEAQKQINSELMEEKHVEVACMTTDFAMQNVLKQMNLSVSALDGRMIKHLRAFILRCYACFTTTDRMSKQFCPKCGNDTLKKVAVTVDEDGKQQIHINTRRPLTGRGKRFSLPTIKGGKHSNFPQLCEDQPMPQQRPSRAATIKNNPMGEDYIAGYSPFIMRDVTSRSAKLGIRPGAVKYWMQRNPNESRRHRKK